MNEMQPILDRIPEEWGKTIRFRQGWNELVLDLDKHIAQFAPKYKILQAKEKFGGLRFYIEFESVQNAAEGADISDAIRLAENKSYSICEVCGDPGRLREGPWIQTLCDVHEAIYQQWLAVRHEPDYNSPSWFDVGKNQ